MSRREEAEAAQQRLQEAMQTQVRLAAMPVSLACKLLFEAAYHGLADAIEGKLQPPAHCMHFTQ